MFTGLIEKTGKVIEISSLSGGKRLKVECDFNYDNIKIGDSISINGACQTVTEKIQGGASNGSILTFEAMEETLKRTNFNELKTGDIVNLERAMTVNSRLDGHIVTGHVDCTSRVISIKKEGIANIFGFECDTELIVEKGSVSINGISLTVSSVSDFYFEVSVLPYTLSNTNLKFLRQNSLVNIEYDIIAKYIKKFAAPEKKSKITREFLAENGF